MDDNQNPNFELGYISVSTWEHKFLTDESNLGELEKLSWLIPEEIQALLKEYLQLEFTRLWENSVELLPYHYQSFNHKFPLRLKSSHFKQIKSEDYIEKLRRWRVPLTEFFDSDILSDHEIDQFFPDWDEMIKSETGLITGRHHANNKQNSYWVPSSKDKLSMYYRVEWCEWPIIDAPKSISELVDKLIS